MWISKAISNIQILIKGAEIVYDVFLTVYGSRLHLYKISLEMSFDHNSFHLHEIETSKTKVMAINKHQINNRDEFWFRKQHQKANPKHTDYQGSLLYDTSLLIIYEILVGIYVKQKDCNLPCKTYPESWIVFFLVFQIWYIWYMIET